MSKTFFASLSPRQILAVVFALSFFAGSVAEGAANLSFDRKSLSVTPSGVAAIRESVNPPSVGLYDDVDATLKERGTIEDLKLYLDSAGIAVTGNEMFAFPMRPEIKVARSQFFEKYRSSLGLKKDADQMVQTSIETDSLGFTYSHWEQRHQGVPVLGRGFVLVDKAEESENDQATPIVRLALGRVAGALSVDVTPVLSEAAALEIVLDAVEAETYAWEAAPNYIKPPSGLLAIASKDDGTEEFRLVYRFLILTDTPLGSWDVRIDAMTGEVLSRVTALAGVDPGVMSVNTKGSGPTFYNGIQNITVSQEGDSYYLASHRQISADAALGLQASMAVADEENFIFGGDDNYFDEPNSAVGVSVKWALERAAAYFMKAHEIDMGKQDDSIYARLMNQSEYAGQAQQSSYLGDGYFTFNGEGDAPSVEPAIVAHEFAHAVFDFDRTTRIKNEMGSIIEAIADFYGVVIRHYAVNGNVVNSLEDWRIGNRWLDNPSANAASPHPDTYLGNHYRFHNGVCGPTNDQCDVHRNSTVISHAFYLMANGTNGETRFNDLNEPYNVPACGLIETEKVVRIASSFIGPENSELTFHQFVGALHDLLKIVANNVEGSQPCLKSFEEAFKAVGLGAAFSEDVGSIYPTEGMQDVAPWPSMKITAEVGSKTSEGTPCEIELFEKSVGGAKLRKLNPIEGVVVTVGISNRSSADEPSKQCMSPPLELEAGQLYMWRFRLTEEMKGAKKPWSKLHKFVTSTMCPTFKKPNAVSAKRPGLWGSTYLRYLSAPTNPWPAQFTWDAVPGAGGYELKVAETESSASTKLEVGVPKATMVLKVKKDYNATLRAVNPDGEKKGPWCEDKAIQFKTSKPTVNLNTPEDFAPVHPWDFALSWNKAGVAPGILYKISIIYIDRDLNVQTVEFGDMASLGRQNLFIPEQFAAFGTNSPSVAWHVTPTGPSPHLEEGNPSQKRTLLLDYTKTQPQLITPVSISVPYKNPGITFRWKPVPGADDYRLRICEESNQGTCGKLLYDEFLEDKAVCVHYPGGNAPDECSQLVVKPGIADFVSDGNEKRFWKVAARIKLEDGTTREGMFSEGHYSIGACSPTLTNPAINAEGVDYGSVDFSWACDWAPGGYKFSISPPITPPATPTGDWFTSANLGENTKHYPYSLEPNKYYQWKVMAYASLNDTNPTESYGFFTTKAKEEPKPEEQPQNCPTIEAPTWHYPMFDNQSIVGNLQWRRVEGAVRYKLERFDFAKCLQGNTTSCSTPIDSKFIDQSAGYPVYNYNGTKVSYYVIDAGPLTDPLNNYVASIRAINACGDMSPDTEDNRIHYFQ